MQLGPFRASRFPRKMQEMTRFSPALVALGVALASAGALIAAHIMQAMGMFPCDLCLRQREAYWIASPLALAAALAPRLKGAPRILAPLLLAAAAASLLYGAGRAVQHTGVVAHWWMSGCSAGGQLSIEDVMKGKGAPLIACDSAPAFFGISLPVYNFFAAAGLAAIAGWAAWRLFAERSGK